MTDFINLLREKRVFAASGHVILDADKLERHILELIQEAYQQGQRSPVMKIEPLPDDTRIRFEQADDFLRVIVDKPGSEAAACPCAATLGTDRPQECDAPFCGCNPAWTDCIKMLQESGWGPQAYGTPVGWLRVWQTGTPEYNHGPVKPQGLSSCERSLGEWQPLYDHALQGYQAFAWFVPGNPQGGFLHQGSHPGHDYQPLYVRPDLFETAQATLHAVSKPQSTLADLRARSIKVDVVRNALHDALNNLPKHALESASIVRHAIDELDSILTDKPRERTPVAWRRQPFNLPSQEWVYSISSERPDVWSADWQPLYAE